jgi:hypothetical protein
MLTEQDRQNCETICKRVEVEHTRLKIEFLRTPLWLIDQALGTSDPERLRQIHQAWSLALENVTQQCEKLAGPLIEVLQVLSRNNPQMEIKYSGVMTGAIVSSILVGVIVGVIIVRCHPSCLLQLGGKNTLVVAIAPLLGIVCATTCVIGTLMSTNLRTVYRKWLDSVPAILAKFFPNYIDSGINGTSESDVAMVIKNSIDKLNIDEDIWHNPEALEMIKQSIQNQLAHLQELK